MRETLLFSPQATVRQSGGVWRLTGGVSGETSGLRGMAEEQAAIPTPRIGYMPRVLHALCDETAQGNIHLNEGR